jgi:2-amino-4-hydroxy-6-hydroxymethyldihydropteridine diphosphokinase
MTSQEEALDLHPTLARAADGSLPDWARMTEERLAHASRVALLLEDWAIALGLERPDRERWIAVGWLHDSVKDEDPDVLRSWVGDELKDLPARVLHGPAAAARLRAEGVEDGGVLGAVAWHTLGHPDFQPVGLALYCADFLEPGRNMRNRWRARLRARMPDDLGNVTRRILRVRIEHLLKKKRVIRPETAGLWNRLIKGRPWVRASGR